MSGYDVLVSCPARYRNDLHFAEVHWYAPGKRVLSVSVEGTERISCLDVLATAGRHAAMVRSFDVDVPDGAVSLEFTKVVEKPDGVGHRLSRSDSRMVDRTRRPTCGGSTGPSRHWAAFTNESRRSARRRVLVRLPDPRSSPLHAVVRRHPCTLLRPLRPSGA